MSDNAARWLADGFALCPGWLEASGDVDPSSEFKVGENKHFLVTETGAPFFWLSESASKILHSRRVDSKR